MKTVSGKLASMKPVNLSKAANILSKFVISENGASQVVSAYLRRSSVAFNDLVYFKKHHKLKKKENEEASTISDISHTNLEEDDVRVVENGGVNKKLVEGKLRKREKKKKSEGSFGSGKSENVEVESEEEGNEMVKRKKKKKKKRKNAEVDGGEIGNLERKKRRRIEADE